MFKKTLATFCIFICSVAFCQQKAHPLWVSKSPKAIAKQTQWVDSVYNTLSLEEKIGQLFMPIVFSEGEASTHEAIEKLIKDYNLGGIIFSKGGPKRQAYLTNRFQKLAKTPLLVAMDAEWGLAMRLDSTYAFPWNLTLGAVRDTALIRKVGKQIGAHCKRLGVHINFAPVVDLNTNANNPIIGNRSFGEAPIAVSKQANALMTGLHQAGVLSNAKHFPGHGDTATDSHETLPTISFSNARIDSIELYPYKKLINQGLPSVMVAHLNVPKLTEKEGLPASLSTRMISKKLKDTLGFQGLIFTDALNMKGASNYTKPGKIDLEAFLAGNDVLLIPEDIPKAVAVFKTAYKRKKLTEARLALSVKKILMAKYKVGLHQNKYVETDNLYSDLNTVTNKVLTEAVFDNALTLIKNTAQTLPFKSISELQLGYVGIGDTVNTHFHESLSLYADVANLKIKDSNGLKSKLDTLDHVIIGLYKSSDNPWKSYKTSKKERDLIAQIAAIKPVTLVVFTSPYTLLDFNINSLAHVLVAYQNNPIAHAIAAQSIFGARAIKGRLPVSINNAFPAGFGLKTKPLKRLQYGLPESVGISSEKLKRVDSLVQKGIYDLMMPGAQVLVARKGKVIYHKAFGYHTPHKKQQVQKTDLYDLASLTKILATLPLVMQLYDSKEIDLDTRLDALLPEYKNSNKGSVTLLEMLTHTGRLKAWIPFYEAVLDTVTGGPSTRYFASKKDSLFSIPVAEALFLRRDYQDTIYEAIKQSELRETTGYKYSDLPYYLLKTFLENYKQTPFSELIQSAFYKEMGAYELGFNPLKRFQKARIPPTEEDNYFRMQKIQGTVHDPGAAMLDGVSGHAGLFGHANDVAKMMQLFLWNGYYGGTQYLKSETIKAFNTCYFCEDEIRRGVGFDKPQLEDPGPTCGCVSMTSFGHSGFTGTFTWADPEEDIVYVFLSNRTYPTAENRMLISSDLRSNVQKLIYEAIIKDTE